MPTWKKAPPKHNRLECRAERHLWPYGLSLAIYTRIGTLTAGGTNPFYGKVQGLAEYFGANKESARRAFKRLVNGGWLEPAAKKGEFRYIPHDKRASVKKDCAELPSLPLWALEADPFVGKIHAVSGGNLRVLPNWIGVVRSVATEEEFLSALREEFANGQGGPGMKFWNVVRHFRQRALKAKKDRVENPV